MPQRALRVVDTGTRGGRENISLDQALIEGHDAGTTPPTLRWLQFTPSALIGRHQDLSRELDLAFCADHAVDVGRRVTGGGAIYLDEHQLGWELLCPRAWLASLDLAAVAARVCSAMADAISDLGTRVRFRPRNDLEFEGRKLGGTGGFFSGSSLFYQGTIILDLDASTMFRALRVPQDKRARHGVADAADRVTSLRAALGGDLPSPAQLRQQLGAGFARRLNFDLRDAPLSDAEIAATHDYFTTEIGQPEFVHAIDGAGIDRGWASAERATAGGTLTAHARCRPGNRHLQQLILSGDYFVTPPRLIYDLESALKDCPIAELDERVAAFFAAAGIDLMSFTVADLRAVVRDAVASATAAPGDE